MSLARPPDEELSGVLLSSLITETFEGFQWDNKVDLSQPEFE